MPPYKQIVVSTGYVETGRAGLIVFQLKPFSQDQFEYNTPREALESLALDLFIEWWNEEGAPYYVYGKDPKAIDYNRIDFDWFGGWIAELPGMTADQIGMAFQSGSWCPWNTWDQIASIPLNQTVAIREQAEAILTWLVNPSKFENALLYDDENRLPELWSSWMANRHGCSVDELPAKLQELTSRYSEWKKLLLGD